MDAAVIPTAEAIKRAHCGETADKMLLKDCMVAKAQIGDLSEQNISSTEELKGYVSRAPVASASNKVYKIRLRSGSSRPPPSATDTLLGRVASGATGRQ
jgi:hypothetical protein